MTEQDILERLTAVFREIFEDDTLIARADMTAADVRRWDSLSHIDMMLLVEEAFGVRFQTREVSNLKDVGALVELIKAKKP